MVYNPKVASYDSLLDIFWENHDSTACSKRQYMSAIFYHTEEQKDKALESLNCRKKIETKPITTQVLPIGTFYDAEDYHQKYFLQKHPFTLSLLGIDPDDMIESSVCCRLNGFLGGYGSLKQFESELPSLDLDKRVASYIRKLLEKGIAPAHD